MNPLVFLHGFAGTPGDFETVESHLASLLGTEPEIFAPWLVGHGSARLCGSELPPPSSATSGRSSSRGRTRRATFEAEVERLAAETALEVDGPSHLVGYSLGGRLVLGLLLAHPELWSGATLISTHPGLETEEERRLREDVDAHWCARLLEAPDGGETEPRTTLESFLVAWEAQPLFQSERRLAPEVLQARRARRLTLDPRGLAHSLRQTGLAQMPAYRQLLPSLTVPVTLLVGALDAKFLALGKTMLRSMPSARLAVLADSGHNLILEKPYEVAKALARQLLDPVGEQILDPVGEQT